MKTMSVVIPSRERPQLLKRALDSIVELSEGFVEVVVAIDEDDPMKEDYKSLINQYKATQLIYTDSEYLSDTYNKMAFTSSGDFIMCGNDDFVWRTKGWDSKVKETMLETFPDEICMGWCNDGTPKSRQRCPAPIVTRKWMDILGYFEPKTYYHLYCDEWVKALGELSGRMVYMDDILVEHCHIGQGKAEMDNTYRKWRTAEYKRRKRSDKKKYRQEEQKRIRDAKKLLRGS